MLEADRILARTCAGLPGAWSRGAGSISAITSAVCWPSVGGGRTGPARATSRQGMPALRTMLPEPGGYSNSSSMPRPVTCG
jgi:hypothetical protein